ncbi:hypothetical protein GGR95_001239 [Sulfitobacter undariae]|uniref:Uncharacterized protein n=1 Tax=Sulfitobacter undariae TaxID=1563671 RepID=A0A7W6E2M0_9RHOB|nr:hypothetical protein [Sulfitobacter undariae]MBB3993608.1 hypothetical protein [Sulfitobacter undariae]
MLRLDAGHHTLTCGACGAPLRKLKMMPVAAAPAKCGISHQAASGKLRKLPKAKRAKPKKSCKKKKSLFRKFAAEAFDLVEDIFD